MIRQSGVIPYRVRQGRLEVLLITRMRRAQAWGIPKGHLEQDLTPVESALLEAYEEAGVRGRVRNRSVGSFRSGIREVSVFLLEVTLQLEEFPEMTLRRREWLGHLEAASRVEEEGLRALLRALPELL